MRYLHTMIFVNDMAESIDFYTTKLGLDVLEGPRPASNGETELAFVGKDLHAYVELMYDPTEHPSYQMGSRYGHLAFEVDGKLTDVLDDLRAKGVKIVSEPRLTKTGRAIAFVEDPNGVAVELLERVPRS